MAQRGSDVADRMKKLRVSHVDPDVPYPMDLPKLGHAIIVNNVAGEIPGSQVDVEALKTAYQTLGFEVHVHNDCDVQDMRKLKRWMLKDETHDHCNMFSLTIICHGNDKGHLLDKNKKRAWITEDIVGDLSEVETLAGKPKLLVLQACRGRNWNEGATVAGGSLADDDDLEVTHILPDKADVFIAFATVPGYRAYGGDHSGSAYLQAFSTFLQEQYMKRPLDRIYLMVKQAMIKAEQGEQKLKQVSEERNSLTRLLYFSEFHQKGASKFSSSTEDEMNRNDQEEEMRRRMREEMNKERRAELEAERQRRIKLEEEIKRLTQRQIQGPQTGATRTDPSDQASQKVASLPRGDSAIPAKTRREVTMELLSTHDSNLANRGYTKMTVMPSTGKVVMFGKLGDDKAAFHVFSKTDGTWTKDEVALEVLCHNGVHPHTEYEILPFGKDSIFLSCHICSSIKLYNIMTGSVTTIADDMSLNYCSMCHGDPGEIFVLDKALMGKDNVMHMTYNNGQLNIVKKVTTSLKRAAKIAYLPAPYRFVVIGNYELKEAVWAISWDSGKVVWDFKGKVDGVRCEARGLLYSEKHDALLVGN